MDPHLQVEWVQRERRVTRAGGLQHALRADCAALRMDCKQTGEPGRVQEMAEPGVGDMHTRGDGPTKPQRGKVGFKPTDCRAAYKQKQCHFFQTVNHTRVIWDSHLKPKGIFGGHLNIRSIFTKGDQIHTLLTESNLDYLCLSETWLHNNIPMNMINIPMFAIGKIDLLVGEGVF